MRSESEVRARLEEIAEFRSGWIAAQRSGLVSDKAARIVTNGFDGEEQVLRWVLEPGEPAPKGEGE